MSYAGLLPGDRDLFKEMEASRAAGPAYIQQVDITSNKTKQTVSLAQGTVVLTYYESLLQDHVVADVTYVDAGGDGIWDAGESIMVSVLLNNEGSTANYSYPGVVLSENSDEASMPDGYEFFWFYGIVVFYC